MSKPSMVIMRLCNLSLYAMNVVCLVMSMHFIFGDD